MVAVLDIKELLAELFEEYESLNVWGIYAGDPEAVASYEEFSANRSSKYVTVAQVTEAMCELLEGKALYNARPEYVALIKHYEGLRDAISKITSTNTLGDTALVDVIVGLFADMQED